MNISSLREEIVKYDLQTKALVQDIRECCGPENALNQLNLEVKEKFKALRRCIDDLEKIAHEQDKVKDKLELLKEIESHRSQAACTQMTLKKANVVAQMMIDKLNRQVLMTSDAKKLRQRQRLDKEGLVKTSARTTDSLMSLSRMMTSQVQQTEDVLQTLVGSSKTVGENQEELKNMGNVIQQSHKLLTKYNRREFTDKVLIFFGLAFFFACVLYIVKKRLF